MQQTQRGESDAALQGASRAYQKYAGKDAYWSWRFRVLKAHILFLRGSYQDALLLLNETPPAAINGTDVVVRQELVQGLAHAALNQFDDARKNFDDAVRTAGPHEADILGAVISARGNLEIDEFQYAEAEQDFHRALSIARQHDFPNVETSALGNLGFVAMKQAHYDESIDWDREALRFSKSEGQQLSSPNILGNLGWSYFEMGDYESALDFFKQAEQSSAQEGLAIGHINWLNEIGNVYYMQRDYPSAESNMQQALALARKLNDKGGIVQCLNDLSQVSLETGRILQAERYYKEAMDIESSGQDKTGVPYTLLVAGRAASSKHDFDSAEALFTKVIDDPNAETSLQWEAEARLAKTFADAGNPDRAENEFQRAIDTIEAARATIKTDDLRLSFLTGAISFYSDYIDFLVSRSRPQDALEVAELSRTHALTTGSANGSAKVSFPLKGFQPAQVAARLNTIILSYWLGPKKSYLWAITQKRTTLFELPQADDIDSLVRSYRGDLDGPRYPLETQNANGERLYDILVAPAANLIPQGARVTIVPDGSLYNLNFETLLAPTPQLHYWIDDVVVANGNSLLLLAASANEKPAKSRKLLLIGDPVSPGAEFPDLPQAPAEMAQIEKYFPPPNRKVLAKQQATADAYLDSQPGQFSFIHFVAHGIASRTSPLDSAVILTKEGDSYKLYARDVMAHHLSADLVTISACHGAGARTYSGEGLVGLTWAFLRAGAHGVIAALWDVNDRSTSEMMNQLYDEMNKGMSPEVALRDAKLAFVHAHTPYRRPFYWAAFQIYRGS
jgi:CHAT domain-containing protein/tetratricopeptide (TPR) repeat protein